MIKQSDLLSALAKDKSEHDGQSIIEYFIGVARQDNTVLIALMRKILPDLRQIEATIEHSDNEWADRTPRDIVNDMDNLTTGDEKNV